MKKPWEILIKETFLNDLFKLPPKEMQQVREKVSMLKQDPTPDGKVKKILPHVPGRPYRIRSGKYRIFYTYNQTIVQVYHLDERDDDTYSMTSAPDPILDADVIRSLNVPTPRGDVSFTTSHQPDWETRFNTATSRKLPEPITRDLLSKLRVPSPYHNRLLHINNEDDLLACPGIDDTYLLQIQSYMFEKPITDIMQEPDYVLNDVDDLLRYREGELLAFLLKLSPEQEKYASWSLNATGPTLVKGGPGTGKSTVALYRIHSLLNQLLASGHTNPRILFTTYTNALAKSSAQLLQQLLNDNARYVEVHTSDSIAYHILNEQNQINTRELIKPADLYKITRQAIAETTFAGNILQQEAQRQSVQRLSTDYIIQELNSVIVARQLDTLEAYLKTSRAGRKQRLNATQRTAIWRVYEHWCSLLHTATLETWEQRRARAAAAIHTSSYLHKYDAVIIDEAQDLDPTLLRTLVMLCTAPNRLFITADANQSIYGSGFNWSDVHSNLRFQGRTSILRANYRSTLEIGEAAQSYLSHGTLENEPTEHKYINNGPLPDARAVQFHSHEIQLLANYFRRATRALRHTINSCAVLCPTDNIGNAIATALQNHGLEAHFMKGRDLNLTRERRTLYVGMTRAMRALLIILPHQTESPVLNGFDPTLWNLNRPI